MKLFRAFNRITNMRITKFYTGGSESWDFWINKMIKEHPL